MAALEYDRDVAVAIDFDNTITENSTYERTGTLNPKAKAAIKRIKELGCTIVLWTTRDGNDLQEALALLDEWGIAFDYINEYPKRNGGRKVNVDFYIDDKSCIEPIDWDKTVAHIERIVRNSAHNSALCNKIGS